jgi:DtxR family transcriptional regulator, Mn-dependent transcriptional regulator
MSAQGSKPLADIKEDGRFVVDSVADSDAALLKKLKAHGIVPGARLQVTRSLGEKFVLKAEGASRGLHLSRNSAEAVQIRSTNP